MRVRVVKGRSEVVDFESYEKLILWLKEQSGTWLVNFDPDDESVEVEVEQR